DTASSEPPATAEPTPGQRELWTIAQLDANGSRAYNEAMRVTLTGQLVPTHLFAAIQMVANRHEAFRTSFDHSGDRLVIAPRCAVAMPIDDLSGMNETEREAEADRLIA